MHGRPQKTLTFRRGLELVGLPLPLPLPGLEEAAEGVEAGLAHRGRGQAPATQAVAPRHTVRFLP